MLHEAGLPHETVMVSTKSHKLQDGTGLLRHQPAGLCALSGADNGDTFARKVRPLFSTSPTWPRRTWRRVNGTVVATTFQEWLNFISTEVQ